MQSIGFTEEFDVAALRERLQKMSDAELLRFGKDARYMCSPCANMGPPREVFVIQLKEAKAEWRRRNDKSVTPVSSLSNVVDSA